tara:strand:- start:20068 stop:20580 length:513 start_codon:yes stop_codon:yes gene_type:complete
MADKQITITKKAVEHYNIRGPHGTWAAITIDADGNAGRIQIASDYGDWQNYWGSCGESFKKFLQGLNLDYVAGKFGANKHFDLNATIASLKENMKEYSPDKKLKGELEEELNRLLSSYDKEEFVRTMYDCDNIMRMENHCPNMINGIEPGFLNFWNKMWPAFLEELKSEI